MTTAKKTTWKQNERTATRSTSGKFTKLNPCEGCLKSAGADYFSDARCDRLGAGLVLCKKCIEKVEAIADDAELLAFYAKAEAKRAAHERLDLITPR